MARSHALTVVQYKPFYILHDLTVALSGSVGHPIGIGTFSVDGSWLGVKDERDSEKSFDPFDLSLCQYSLESDVANLLKRQATHELITSMCLVMAECQ